MPVSSTFTGGMFELRFTETHAIKTLRYATSRSREISIATKLRVLRNSAGT